MRRTRSKPSAEPLEETVAALMAQVDSPASQNESLARDNANLARDVREGARLAVGLSEKLGAASKAVEGLLERIRLANQRRFGSKSEKADPDQPSLFNDMECAYAPDAAEPKVDDILPKTKPRRRGGERAIGCSKLGAIVIGHEIPAGERACPERGCELTDMDVEVARRVRLAPARLVVEERRRRACKCDERCRRNAEGEETPAAIVRAPRPEGPIPGSFATGSPISYIINAKCSNSMPLYRIEADFETLGVPMSGQNMPNRVMSAYARWISRIHARMREILPAHRHIHAGETPVQALKEPNREADERSRMRLFCAAECDVPVCVCRYDEARSRKAAQDFLRGWSGALATDGYRPCFNLGLPGVKNVACLVRVRRKFAEIAKAAGGDEKASQAAYSSPALEGRDRIDGMFDVDSKLDRMAPAAREAAREEELRPLMESFMAWARESIALASPGLALHRALGYAIAYRPYVVNVLDDGSLVLSNNIAERGTKPFAIGRKNRPFGNTPRGAEASAAMYSVVATAKANGLNPRACVQWLLDEMPGADNLDDGSIDRFPPWPDRMPEEIKLDDKAARKAKEMADDPIVDVDEEAFRDPGDESQEGVWFPLAQNRENYRTRSSCRRTTTTTSATTSSMTRWDTCSIP